MLGIIKELYQRGKNHDVTGQGAQVAFYLILSFFPFLLVILTLIAYTPLLNRDVLMGLAWLLPESTYALVISVTEEIISKRNVTLMSFSMIATLWIASQSIRALANAINRAFNIKESRPLWKTAGLSFLLTLFFAFSITVSFLGLVLGETIGKYVFEYLGLSMFFTQVWDGFRYVSAITIMIILFSVLYRYLPNRSLGLNKVLPGAIFTTLGWVILSLGFSYWWRTKCNPLRA